MQYFKLSYEDGTSEVVRAESDLDCIKRFNLATREHVNTRIMRLQGEEEAIAIANFQEQDAIW